jgi:hypothetical protein
MIKELYSFNWTSGGWNQVFATSKEEAISEIARQFPSGSLTPNLDTLQLVTNTEAYWNGPRWID